MLLEIGSAQEFRKTKEWVPFRANDGNGNPKNLIMVITKTLYWTNKYIHTSHFYTARVLWFVGFLHVFVLQNDFYAFNGLTRDVIGPSLEQILYESCRINWVDDQVSAPYLFDKLPNYLLLSCICSIGCIYVQTCRKAISS